MRLTLLIAVLLAAACGEDDPAGTADAAPRDDAAPPADAPPAIDAAPSGCQPLATDYLPATPGDDTWPACISDDNAYHRFNESISTIARVAGFESIADLLFTGAAPSAQDFTDARLIYLEENGLDSRVSRREDEHYPPAPMSCRDLSPDDLAMYPDRCVGPVQIQPILNDAFAAGQIGTEPRINAARIEAALLWFLYVSVHKEATTCTVTVADCDSHYAYYTGGEDRSGGLGFARYVRERSVEVHDRVWDGILAVRCWRDLDNPTGEAMDLAQRDRAIAQLDRAALKGVALIVRERVVQLASATGEDADVLWAFLTILGPVLDREAEVRDPTNAAVLAAEWAKTDPATVDTGAIIEALDVVFDCP